MHYRTLFDTGTYVQRRSALLSDLSARTGGIVLLPGHTESPVNYPDNCYPFRQDSTFLYFFGHDVPDMAGTLDLDSGEVMLWGTDATMDDIIWTGPVPAMAERAERCGAAWGGDATALMAYVGGAASSGRTIHYLPPYRAETRELLTRLTGIAGSDLPRRVSQPLTGAVVTLRSVKTAEEVAEIESALAISHEMYMTAMRTVRPGMTERALCGTLQGIAASAGSGMHSFRTILTVRGETLHNHGHACTMQDGDLLLIDSGAESLRRYASDITRTLPVSGRFSGRQKAIYETVLNAQLAGIARATAGRRFLDAHLAAAQVMVEGLKEAGIMKGNTQDAVAEGAHALFFPHGLGHMMGLDVHDMEHLGEDNAGYAGEVERSRQFGLRGLRLARTLHEGFVLTVEPGVYFIPDLIARWTGERRCADFICYDRLHEWSGFGGIRIEDDVLVTAGGPQVLGRPIPKTVREIEEAMRG
ncbi:aminopeptidase P family protein [Oleidesulfovibrio alaskensis]|jgi:Xaa-Pro aminopeptidase|uniref:aminopeptidase P family protein n=1 Tax=Oleidesulfovibrio alaskensis TaxID=58180 RepID=UPI001A5BC6F4|nr:aminopeptidase P family protein [Oleidesulfovibrio alaskensis]MBL3581323.1 aminopeptidase P family protein [Oleidesulfovibrio alaskensis]